MGTIARGRVRCVCPSLEGGRMLLGARRVMQITPRSREEALPHFAGSADAVNLPLLAESWSRWVAEVSVNLFFETE